MNNTEYIENYFKGTRSEAEKQQFEDRILKDSLFAKDVAFYISATGLIDQQLKEEKRQRFREIYEQQKVAPIKQPVKNIRLYLAAASIIFIVILSAVFLSGSKTSPQQLADNYIQKNWKSLAVTMGSQDSIETGLSLYNSGKLAEALIIFETLAKNNTSKNNINAKKYAGIVSLRLQIYDKALAYFSMLEANTSLYSNPGKFYKAITLLKRNQNGDKENAELLLIQVKDNNLEGKKEAVDWLEKL